LNNNNNNNNRKILESQITHNIEPNERFSEYARRNIKFIDTRNGIYKAIKRGELLLDGNNTETGRFVKEGQLIELIDSGEKRKGKIFRLKLEVIYEDEYLAIINKPAGFEVMGKKFKTIENSLPYNLELSSQTDVLPKPKPVHRLDFPTSGLLLIAKTQSSLVKLSKMFEDKTISKIYEALVIGKISEKKGIFNSPIEEREAISEYEVIASYNSLRSKTLTHIKLFPKTGRTHQLRIHLSRNGTPILGDKQYGIEGLILKDKGLFLSSIELNFRHPFTNEEIDMKISHPEKFDTYITREKRRWEKYNL